MEENAHSERAAGGGAGGGPGGDGAVGRRPAEGRREVAAGTRAYSVGFQDGRFYANGWHITGEMGGIWAPPLKLADGVWFGVDDAWVGEATKFTSGRGYVRYDLPDASGLKLRRTDFSPDGKRAVLYGLELTNPGGAPKTVTVKVDAHSELMTAYPWGWTTPNAGEANGADTGAVRDGALAFSDGAFTSFVASDRRADGAEAGAGHWGAQPGTDCDPGGLHVAAERAVTTARSATAPAASCATRSRSGRAGPRRSGSRSRRRNRTSRARCATRTASWPRRPARARGSASTPSSTCPATGSCRRRSTGASRTSPTSRRRRPT